MARRAVAPLTLDVRDHPRDARRARTGRDRAVLRVIAVAGAVILYPYLWTQAAAFVDQITNSILSLHPVSTGLYKLMDIAVGGRRRLGVGG